MKRALAVTLLICTLAGPALARPACYLNDESNIPTTPQVATQVQPPAVGAVAQEDTDRDDDDEDRPKKEEEQKQQCDCDRPSWYASRPYGYYYGTPYFSPFFFPYAGYGLYPGYGYGFYPGYYGGYGYGYGYGAGLYSYPVFVNRPRPVVVNNYNNNYFYARPPISAPGYNLPKGGAPSFQGGYGQAQYHYPNGSNALTGNSYVHNSNGFVPSAGYKGSAYRGGYSAPRPSFSAPRPSFSSPRPSFSAPRPSFSSGGFSGGRKGGRR